MRKTKIDDVTPAKGPVAKVKKERFEIAARFFESLAMTRKRTLRHCEERSDEAISTFSTSPKAGVHGEQSGFPLEFIPHTMRGGNDK